MRPGRGELISLVSALALLVLMFAAGWYEYDRVPGTPAARHGVVDIQNGWQALTLLRWLMLATIVVVFASFALRASQRTHGRPTSTGFAVAGLGAVTAAFLIVRVLIDLPSPAAISDQKLGALLGLLASLGIALGGWDWLWADRAQASAPRRRRQQERVGQPRITPP
jgi:hypothetical protein